MMKEPIKCDICTAPFGEKEGDHVELPSYIITITDSNTGLVNAKYLADYMICPECFHRLIEPIFKKEDELICNE